MVHVSSGAPTPPDVSRAFRTGARFHGVSDRQRFVAAGTLVLGVTLGAGAVVVFSTTRTVTRLVIQAIASINNAIWPELSRSVGSGHLEEARAILLRAVQLALAGSLLVSLGLAFFGVAIVRWWSRGLVDPPVPLLLMLLLVVVANSTWYTLSSVLVATNRHMRFAVVYLLATTAALLSAVPLSEAFGLEGAGLALLAIDVTMVAYVFPAAMRVVQNSPGRFLRSLLDVRGAVRSAISSVRSAV